MKSFLLEIRNKYKELRISERKVADAILEEKVNILDCTIEDFSKIVGVSQPTIIRFANAMGLKGYKELKKKFIEEKTKENANFKSEYMLSYPIQENDKLIDIPAKIIMTNIKHLEEALKNLSMYEFINAVKALHQANKISVYAVENSVCTAEDFVTKMAYIGKSVFFNKDGYMQKVNALSLTNKDVAIGISHTGKSTYTVKALQTAKKSGAITIAITNFEDAIINKYADIILCTGNKQYMYGNAIFSRCAQITFVDMLYLGMFLLDYEKNSLNLNKSWENIQDLIYEK